MKNTYLGLLLGITNKYYIVGFKNPITKRYFNLRIPKQLLPEGYSKPRHMEEVLIGISSLSTADNIIPVSIIPTGKIFDPIIKTKSSDNVFILSNHTLRRTLFAIFQEGYEDMLDDIVKVKYKIGNKEPKWVVEINVDLLPIHILKLRGVENTDDTDHF